MKPRKARKNVKLHPLQYRLRFPPLNDWEVPRQQRKNKGYLGGPYIVFYNGKWHVYRNRWKSQFRGPRYVAAALTAPTIPELIECVRKSRDVRFGWSP